MYVCYNDVAVPVWIELGAKMSDSADFGAFGRGDKVRLTLWLEPRVKDALKEQASTLGVSSSAYVSVLVGERMKDGKSVPKQNID